MTTTKHELLSAVQVAELLGVHPVTVNRWAVDGKLPVAAKGPGQTGGRLYDREDVLAFRNTKQ